MSSTTRRTAGPVVAAEGIPLRVAVYKALSDDIREGVLMPGSLLPSEAELVAQLGVSRTVVREALIFLEEDGLIRSRRGIGRFVSERLPASGIERITSPERLLTQGEDVQIDSVSPVVQESPASFAQDALGLEDGRTVWFVETIVRRDVPIGLVQEHVAHSPAGAAPTALEELIEAGGTGTLLARALSAGLPLGAGSTEIGVALAGATRAEQLGMDADDAVLVLTRQLQLAGIPYLSKIIVNPHEVSLSIAHTGA